MKRLEIKEDLDRAADALVLTLVGRLDSTNTYAFNSAIMDHIANGERSLIVDLDRLDFISRSGLAVLRKAARKLASRRGHVVLCGVPNWVREVLSISGLDRCLPMRGSRPAAVALLLELRQSLSSRPGWRVRLGDILRSAVGR